MDIKSLIHKLLPYGKNSLKYKMLKESEVFCMAPWVHMHMAPQGQVFPCCISAHYLDQAPGHVKDNTLKEIWNSEKMKEIRLNMLNGQENKLCDLCHQYQKIGKKSPRNDFNEEFGKHFNLVRRHTNKETGELKKYRIHYIDFRFSNLCNFKCRICSHHFSTSWYTEALKMNLTTEEKGRLIVPVDDPEVLWDQIVPILPYMEKIHFAGGEPLIMEEHYRILKYFAEHQQFDVKLSYNTNFSEMRYKDLDAIDMWKNFEYVLVCASLDGSGARGEYMRKGQNWEQTVNNRKRMLKECPHIKFQLTPAVGIMNVLHLPDFYREWVEEGLLSPEELNLYMVFEPEFYNIQNLPEEFKKRVEDKYQRFFDEYVSQFDRRTQDHILDQFNQVLTHMNHASPFDPRMASYNDETFTTYNMKLDEMRKENFLEVFPELADLYDT